MTFEEKLKYERDRDKLRTPVPGCPSCIARKVHSKEDWEKYHPDRGQGLERIIVLRGVGRKRCETERPFTGV